MIEDQQELEYSIEQLAKMYRMRDRSASEAVWSPELRKDVVESTESMIRKIERKVAEYLAKQYGLIKEPAEKEPSEVAA